MSHIAHIKTSITNLNALKKAAKRLNGEFRENQKEFIYYSGQKGECEHAIHFNNCAYEIGVTKGEGKEFNLAWDPYNVGGLEKVVGKEMGLLKQYYALETAKQAAMVQGYTSIEKKQKDGSIKLVITV